MKNYYAILELNYDCTGQEIRNQYLKMSKTFHPDINSDLYATRMMEMVNEAYAILSDPIKKHDYDTKIGLKKLLEEERYRIKDKGKRVVLKKNGYFRK